MAVVGLVDNVLSQARTLLDQGQIEEAAACVCQITTVQDLAAIPCDRLELLGEISVETGQTDQARLIFLEAVKKSQDTEEDSYSKYLWLAQITEDGGKDAARWFEKGIKLLGERLELKSNDVELRQTLASALSGLAEVYLTELCMEDDAEDKCQEYVTRAIELDPHSFDAYQTLASIRISQQRVEEAKQALHKSLSVLSLFTAESINMPTYSSRISLSRLLIEVGEYSSALELLSALQKEDDQIVDLWYLYGWCYFISGEESQDEEEKRASFRDARDCLEVCERLYNKLDWEDEGIKEHAMELLAIINTEIPQMIDDESEENGGDWEELQSSDSEVGMQKEPSL